MNADSPGERGQADSRALLDKLYSSGIRIIVPTLLVVEVAGVVARTRGDSLLAQTVASDILALPHLFFVALDSSMSLQAADLAAKHHLRGADAVYAAVALSHKCDLVSLDHEHLTRLTTVLNAITPSDALAKLTLHANNQ
jgi:predicted nucleic acid-binding protein